MKQLTPLFACLLPILLLTTVLAQSQKPANSTAPLFFREDWKEIPAETPVSQKHVVNPDLILALYGTAKDQIKKSHHDQPADDPYYIWSGTCKGTWGLTLARKDQALDLSRGGLIQWRSRQSGERFPRILIRLADGRFYVSDQTDTNAADWHVFAFIVDRLTWSALNADTFLPIPLDKKPDLRKVLEIGFTDLEPGVGTPVSSRIDWIEVFGYGVPR